MTNDDARTVGDEARYYVRGGIDPRFSTEAAVGHLTRAVLADDTLTPAARAKIAVSALRGWVEHRPQPEGPRPIWHRYLNATRTAVIVTEVAA